jgi:hypothetical protein
MREGSERSIKMMNEREFDSFMKMMQKADCWDVAEPDEWREACEHAGIDYDQYDDPDQLWNDLVEFWDKHYVFYAVLAYDGDNDWGYGSHDYDEAVQMAKDIESVAPGWSPEDVKIAVIEGRDDPICEEVISRENW